MSEWNMEQIILNKMLWDQGLTKEDALRPEIAFQYFGDDPEKYNGISISEAKAFHIHATKGADQALEKMKAIIEERV